MNSPPPNPTDDLDGQIDRTLSALGAVKPASDLHDRVLHALAQRAVQGDPHRSLGNVPNGARTFGKSVISTEAQRRGETPVFRRWRLFGLGTAALAASFAVFVLLPHKTAQKMTAQKIASPETGPWQARETAQTSSSPNASSSTRKPGAPSSPAALSPVKVGPSTPSFAPFSLHLVASGPRSAPLPSAPQDPTRNALDQQALADFHAPSQPAPPLPPTPQERLVRLMLRRGETHDLAQLDPEGQALFAKQEQSAFHEFFDPPPSPALAKAFREANRLTAPLQPPVEPASAQPNSSIPVSGDQQ